MKKIFCICMCLVLLATCSYAQRNKLYQIKQTLEKKVSVGSSTDEVKKILGKPNAIEGGFPQSDEMIISSFPDQVGQVNSSTWFYIMSISKLTSTSKDDAIYYLNGKVVQEDVFNEYKSKDSVWFHDGKPISLLMVEGYRIMQDKSLEIHQKLYNECSIPAPKTQKVTSLFMPILCVIFDRGTQVVAATKVYFKLVL